MRNMLILGGIGILSMPVWTVTLDAETGHGATHGSHGHGGLAGHMRQHGGHPENMGMILPTQLEMRSYVFPGEPVPVGPVVGGPEHLAAGHSVGPARHPHVYYSVQVEQEEASVPQPTGPGAAESD